MAGSFDGSPSMEEERGPQRRTPLKEREPPERPTPESTEPVAKRLCGGAGDQAALEHAAKALKAIRDLVGPRIFRQAMLDISEDVPSA